jgi:hypothetical protein
MSNSYKVNITNTNSSGLIEDELERLRLLKTWRTGVHQLTAYIIALSVICIVDIHMDKNNVDIVLTEFNNEEGSWIK